VTGLVGLLAVIALTALTIALLDDGWNQRARDYAAITATAGLALTAVADGWTAAAAILGCYLFVAALLGGVAWTTGLPLTDTREDAR
jgi:hypothetical protein